MILVTGGAGYIGSHTVHQLVQAGQEVVVLDNLTTGHRWAVPPGVPLEVGSIGDFGFVSELLKRYNVRSVIHFAAALSVEESTRRPDFYYDNNVRGAMELIRACRQSQVKEFIFSSTCATYGTPSSNPVVETMPLNPVSTYGKTKAIIEWYLDDLNRAGQLSFRYASLRYFNVAGAQPEGKIGHVADNATQLVSVACEVAAGRRPHLLIYGTDYPTKDGTSIRDYIHVEDLASVHRSALSYLQAGGKSDVFNCGYGTGYSVREVVSVMKKVTGIDFKVVETGRRAGDAVAIYADPTKTKSALRWEPRYADLETICRSSWLWETQGRPRVATAS